MGRGILLAALALAAGLGAPHPAAAQPRPEGFCFRANRGPDCVSYLIFELRGSGQLWHTDRLIDVEATAIPGDPGVPGFSDTRRRHELGHTLAWDLGLAFNVNDDWSVGGTVSADLDGARRDAALHVRKWVTDRVSLEVVPGVFTLDDQDGRGYRLGARVILWELVLEARYDVFDVPASVTIYDRIGGGGTITTTDPGGLEHGFSLGGGLQGVSGVLGTVALLALASAFGGVT